MEEKRQLLLDMIAALSVKSAIDLTKYTVITRNTASENMLNMVGQEINRLRLKLDPQEDINS